MLKKMKAKLAAEQAAVVYPVKQHRPADSLYTTGGRRPGGRSSRSPGERFPVMNTNQFLQQMGPVEED